MGNATFFHTTGVAPSWRNSFLRVGQVGNHIFYRFGGRAGSSNAFSYAARGSTGADMQRAVYAGIDPAATVRQAGQAIAYTALLAQENLSTDAGQTTAPASSVAAPVAETSATPPVPAIEAVPMTTTPAAPSPQA